jgi:hypothetical protein
MIHSRHTAPGVRTHRPPAKTQPDPTHIFPSGSRRLSTSRLDRVVPVRNSVPPSPPLFSSLSSKPRQARIDRRAPGFPAAVTLPPLRECQISECLDWLLIVGRRHLEHVLRTYKRAITTATALIEHWHRSRPTRSIGPSPRRLRRSTVAISTAKPSGAEPRSRARAHRRARRAAKRTTESHSRQSARRAV